MAQRSDSIGCVSLLPPLALLALPGRGRVELSKHPLLPQHVDLSMHLLGVAQPLKLVLGDPSPGVGLDHDGGEPPLLESPSVGPPQPPHQRHGLPPPDVVSDPLPPLAHLHLDESPRDCPVGQGAVRALQDKGGALGSEGRQGFDPPRLPDDRQLARPLHLGPQPNLPPCEPPTPVRLRHDARGHEQGLLPPQAGKLLLRPPPPLRALQAQGRRPPPPHLGYDLPC
mmetsp:Transcript_2829/g.6302  ORF Transcript_2829/g.6302 Transcript_2829/m.6302 type:complete len:226 (-) Transcript_2829:82-759(-)